MLESIKLVNDEGKFYLVVEKGDDVQKSDLPDSMAVTDVIRYLTAWVNEQKAAAHKLKSEAEKAKLDEMKSELLALLETTKPETRRTFVQDVAKRERMTWDKLTVKECVEMIETPQAQAWLTTLKEMKEAE